MPDKQMTAAYVSAVLTVYLDLPDTPLRPSPLDQSLASKLQRQAVPLPLVESALLLATLRRLSRPLDLPPLLKIRSPAYFLPVIEELQQRHYPTATSTTFASSSASSPCPPRLMFRKIRF